MTTEQPETEETPEEEYLDPTTWDAEDALNAVEAWINENPSATDYQIIGFINQCRAQMGVVVDEDTTLEDGARAAYMATGMEAETITGGEPEEEPEEEPIKDAPVDQTKAEAAAAAKQAPDAPSSKADPGPAPSSKDAPAPGHA